MTDTQRSPATVPLLADSALVISTGLLAIGQLLFAGLSASLPEHAALAIWAEVNQGHLSWLAELLAIAAVVLVPGLWLLWRTLRHRGQPATALAWTGLASTTVITTLVAALFAGKLAFTPYAMGLSAEAAEIACGLIAGSLHMTALALGAGMVLNGVAGRRHLHAGYVVLSVVAGATQIASAWPWLMPEWVMAAASLLLPLWAACTLRALGAVPAMPPAMAPARDDEAALGEGEDDEAPAQHADDDAAAGGALLPPNKPGSHQDP